MERAIGIFNSMIKKSLFSNFIAILNDYHQKTPFHTHAAYTSQIKFVLLKKI